VTEADAALLVADDDEGGEAETRPPLTTFATRLMWTSLSTNSLSRSSSRVATFFSCHGDPILFREGFAANPVFPASHRLRSLEVQAAFASGVSQRLDAAVIDDSRRGRRRRP
jgi:hypothetical protein